MSASQPNARLQYDQWKRWPKSHREPTHDEWAAAYDQLRGNLSLAEEGLANYQQENAQLRAEIDSIKRTREQEKDYANTCYENERLRIALRYWLPDETMIPKGHEIAWNEHVELIPEHRRSPPQTVPQSDKT